MNTGYQKIQKKVYYYFSLNIVCLIILLNLRKSTQKRFFSNDDVHAVQTPQDLWRGH